MQWQTVAEAQKKDRIEAQECRAKSAGRKHLFSHRLLFCVVMECWASTLGDCCEGKSGEHYISKGVFGGETIAVRGFPWCPDEPCTIGISSAVANMLCGKHNSALSQFDDEATKLAAFLKEKPLAAVSVRLNGVLLEKWALKTFFNLGYLRGFHGCKQVNPFQPPEGLVRYLYCNEPVADGIGLYLITGNDRKATRVGWHAIHDQGEPDKRKLYGMRFSFFGARFVVNIVPQRVEQKIAAWGKVEDFDYSTAKAIYRPTGIQGKSEAGGEKLIELTW